jgi:hypothetical protein
MTKILDRSNKHSIFLSPQKSGSDPYTVDVPPGEVFHSARLTILDIHLPADAHISLQPPRGAQGNLQLIVDWKCQPNTMVSYQLEAFSCPPGDLQPGVHSPVTRSLVGFLPSQDGFHFNNSFDPVPTVTIPTPFGAISVGDASKGLCGGMVYAALDYFNAHRPIPPVQTPPEAGPLFGFIVERLVVSFDIPTLGFMKFVELMNPNFPDFQPLGKRPPLVPLSRAWTMIRQEWPILKKNLDAGRACPLGLVEVLSTDVSRLGENHQVLTYGYDLVDDELTLYIYDPNYHDDDAITLKLNVADPNQAVNLAYSKGNPVYCFFHTDYTPVSPVQV